MATLHGHAWLLEPTFARQLLQAVPPPVVPPSPPVPSPELDAPETIALLARALVALSNAPLGRPLGELRVLLAEPTEAVQRALVTGLRTKKLRRVGAHNKLRYVRNG